MLRLRTLRHTLALTDTALLLQRVDKTESLQPATLEKSAHVHARASWRLQPGRVASVADALARAPQPPMARACSRAAISAAPLGALAGAGMGFLAAGTLAWPYLLGGAAAHALIWGVVQGSALQLGSAADGYLQAQLRLWRETPPLNAAARRLAQRQLASHPFAATAAGRGMAHLFEQAQRRQWGRSP